MHAALRAAAVGLAATWLAVAAQRPNILWITSEDNGPRLGTYGDPLARTPNLDRLAARGTRYLNCFSNAAVCAPARQTLISGMYATSLGGQHMRSDAVFPPGVAYFPAYLRDAGYYTTNNSKTDYNGGPADREAAIAAAWDESSNEAHWRNRPDGKPFFAVFNINHSHESRLFPSVWEDRPLETDPSSVRLPAYLPDLPQTRLDLARFYDCLERMDEAAGRILDELEADGLVEDTIVFYFGDHGGALPRGKSFTYDSGTRVPLIVRIPERWKDWRPSQPGGETDRLVGFVDFAATVLSLAGLDAPSYMQGQAFLGERAGREREYAHTFRGRRGERYDIVRGVRSKRYLYLRNYTPHLPVMQFNGYSFAIPGYRAWMDACARGECAPEQARWFGPKPPEELYDAAADPDNVRNLASDPEYATVLQRLRAENSRHIATIRDSVFYPEGLSGREYAAYQSDETYPLARLIALAARVSEGTPGNLPAFVEAMRDENASVRYWGVMGSIVLGEQGRGARGMLRRMIEDPEPLIRIQAARALAGMGDADRALPTVRRMLAHDDPVLRLRAALAVDECGLLALDPQLESLLRKVDDQYADRVTERVLSSVGRVNGPG